MMVSWKTEDGKSFLIAEDNGTVVDENGVLIVKCPDRLEAVSIIRKVGGYIRYLEFKKRGNKVMSDLDTFILKYVCWLR